MVICNKLISHYWKKLRRYSLLYGLVKGAKGKQENFDERNDLDDLNVEDDETIKDEINVYNDWKELESAKYLLMDLLRELNKELGEYWSDVILIVLGICVGTITV